MTPKRLDMNEPTMKTDTKRAQKVMEEFYSTFSDKRQDFIIQKLNNDAIVNVLREVINQLQQSPGVIMCADMLELCEELKNYD